MNGTTVVFAVLHVADFPLHAVLRTEETDPARPAALFAGTGKWSAVIAANAAARSAGVVNGLSAPQAMARCAPLLIRAPLPAAEAESRALLLAAARTLAPLVEDTAPGSATADLRGAELPRTEAAARAAAAHLSAAGLPASAGIARTPFLALLAARRTGPGGVTSVTNEEAFLDPLPVEEAGPTPALAPVLAAWGVRTLGALRALSPAELAVRLGAEGPALARRARGGDPRPLRPCPPPRDFTAAMDLEEPVATLEPLLFLLRRFTDRLALELRAAGLAAAGLELALRLEEGDDHRREFRLPEPTSDPAILFRALHTHLESLRTGAALAGLRLRALPVRAPVRQQGLLDSGLRDPHGFADTLARVSALVGAEGVGTPRPGATHRPDSVTLEPPPDVVPPPEPEPPHAPWGPPLRRFRPPLPARLEFRTGDRRPAYVWTERFRGEVAEVHGPWNASGGWWQTDLTWSRAEWDIVLAEGGLYRLLRAGDAWFIEGEYD